MGFVIASGLIIEMESSFSNSHPQYLHLIASTLIYSAQSGHFTMSTPPSFLPDMSSINADNSGERMTDNIKYPKPDRPQFPAQTATITAKMNQNINISIMLF